MTRAVINLVKLSHLSTRTRYRLLFTCFILTTTHLLFSASLIRWSANLTKPAHADPRSASKTSGNAFSKDHVSPYGAEDAGRPVVPQAKLLKDFFTWNETDIASLSPPVFLPPTPPSPPITDPFPLLSSNLAPHKLRRLLQPPEINHPSHFRHLHPSLFSSQELTQQPSRSYFSRFGGRSFGRRPDPSPSSPYHCKLNPTGMAPLLIGFTRNWPLLLQCVSSYIAAGWPAEEIFVVENTGTMDANERELLTLQNPFFMNRTQLGMLGVNVVSTPTLLTFSQLQNFFAWTALQRGWTEYFWSHQDVIVFSYEHRHPSTSSKTFEDDEPEEYRSLYANALHTLQQYRDPSHPKWAHHFFSYDHLTLVHRDAILSVGGWDTHIPFYGTDCDMYTRLMWAGYAQNESTTPTTRVGHILDVSTVLDDVGALFRIPGIKASFPGDPDPHARKQKAKAGSAAAAAAAAKTGAETYANLLSTARRMQRAKYALGNGHEGRNKSWQVKQQGGQGEPFYRDADGFEAGVEMWIEAGRAVFSEKWGHRGCDIARKWATGENKGNGNGLKDGWRVERDWDADKEGGGGIGGGW
ncbi:hypothetical protein QBC32DRAFT_213896 [Pseudoneurospora amorphoporcata]|uniref:Uncharacterized protein n=1 Tax=Pseudoneurospora amorphoporcata TaxID=241081 RepID=A0AAN6SGA5_9PEZI|nr:hypothetical protein QBC32DRAFT_213896 [Pseudoneurospora amorphoporcata]